MTNDMVSREFEIMIPGRGPDATSAADQLIEKPQHSQPASNIFIISEKTYYKCNI